MAGLTTNPYEVLSDPRYYNDIYLPVFNTDRRRVILYGSRDTGKSHFIAQKLVYDCLTLKYFKCVFVRKYYKTIRESQWSKIKSVISQFGLSVEFQFNRNPVEIIHLPTGNRFIGIGMDDPDKAKSLDDPTHAWYEEADQIKEDDFDTFTLSLRNSKGIAIREFLSFNSGNPKHWIIDRFFPPYKKFAKEIERKDGLHTFIKSTDSTAVILHTCYKHNQFMTPDRVALYEQMKEKKPRTYKVKGLGLFGRDNEGALWSDKLIDDNRVNFHPDLYRLCVALDPSASDKKDSDEAGVIAAGKSYDQHYYILADRSGIYSPKEQATEAIKLYYELNADALVVEKNNGGDWLETVIHDIDPNINVVMVWASRGKATRAEPVVNLYENGFVHHVKRLDDLETEQTEWVPKEGRSPNRVDACVWAITWLMSDTIDKTELEER